MISHKISTLLFITDPDDRILLLQRKKAPNLGMWSPPGGKLDTLTGESPHQCAIREAHEETGMRLELSDLHLFAMISERAYEGETHWLMFLFHVKPALKTIPVEISEGQFSWFTVSDLETLAIPPTDRALVWPFYFKNRDGFTSVHADFQREKVEIEVEESI